MSNNMNNRRGSALGAIVALVASLFVGAAPANAAASTSAFTFTPALGTSFNMFVDEDFTVNVSRVASEVSGTDLSSYLKYSITTNRSGANNSTYSIQVLAKSAASSLPVAASSSDHANYDGQDIYYVASYAIGGNPDQVGYNAILIGNGDRTTISPTVVDDADFGTAEAGAVATHSYTVVPADRSATTNNQLTLRLTAPGLTSTSPSVTVTVTAFLDLNGDNVWQPATEVSKTQAINFISYGSLTQTVTNPAPTRGTIYATASAAVSGVNFDQLDGKFFLNFRSGYENHNVDEAQNVVSSFSSLVALTEATAAAGRLSASKEIHPASVSYTFSAQLAYSKDGTAALPNATDGLKDVFWPLGAASTVAAPGIDTLNIEAVPSANLTIAGAARPNSSYTVRAGTRNLSATASDVAVEFSFSGTGALSATQTLAVNGGTPATTSHNVVEVDSDANGFATINLVATGYANGETIVITATSGGYSNAITLTMNDVGSGDVALTIDNTVLSMAPSSTLNIPVAVKDQYGEAPVGTYRVKFAKPSSGFDWGSSTNSYATLTGTAATGAVTSTAKTGSMTVTVSVEKWNTALSRWEDQSASGDTSVTVYITNDANGFAYPSGFASSYSATVSYPVTNWGSYSWSAEINTLDAVVTGSPVVLSGAGLIFQDTTTLATASDTITILSSSADRSVKFKVTSLKSGTYTLTATAGSATTTSLIVVRPVFDNAGTSLTFDTTQLTPGSTKFVTGTVLDENGNPVDTSQGNADLVITFAGDAGIPVGTTPTETDANGQFRVAVLTASGDKGTFTITATYRKYGAASAAVNKVTTVQSITIGAAAAEASDQKLTVGSFKGYVAIYALNYTGQKLSAKVAGKWLVQENLSRFQRVVRNTGAGYTIKVDLYVDGVFVRSETVVTK